MKKVGLSSLFLIVTLVAGYLLGLFFPIISAQQSEQDSSLLTTIASDGADQLASNLDNQRLILLSQTAMEKSEHTSKSIMLALESIQRQLDQLDQDALHGNNPEVSKHTFPLEAFSTAGSMQVSPGENTDAVERFIDDDDDDVDESRIEAIENVIGNEALSHLSLNEINCKNTICMITYDGDLAGPNQDGDMVMAKLLSDKLGNRNYTINYSEDEFGKKSMFLELE